ncbi:MAG TPA: hypothetical protein VEZ47_06475, partial [Gemmatirosa sp.]|nr:hypothetical protein [Gemmatirosa sp.]
MPLLPAVRTARPARAGRAPCALLAVLVASTACDRDRPAPPRPDSTPVVTVAPPPPEPPPAVVATSAWAGEAGLALVVPGAQGEALLVVPGTGDGTAPADTAAGAATAVLPGEVTLYGRGGLAGEARAVLAGEGRSEDGCASWPTVRLGPATGADAVPGWTLGLVHRAGEAPPSAIALDSLEALHGADSATVAATVTRLAAALPATQRRRAGRFHGLPFVVRSARRFTPARGR